MSDQSNPPRVFISYSWENDGHKDWVRSFAERLTRNGVNVRLDQWHIVPGQSLTQFMENEVPGSDFTLLICTKDYARRAIDRAGGVGYEQQIITGHIASGVPREKFIPIIRDGTFEQGAECAVPPSFLGIYAIDMRDGTDETKATEDLLRAVFRQPALTQPEIGPRPSFGTPPEAVGTDDTPEAIRLASMEMDGWELASGVARHHLWPDSFWIPEEHKRRTLVEGDCVKLMFDIELDPDLVPDEKEQDENSRKIREIAAKGTTVAGDFSFCSERMWVLVRGMDGPYYVGELNNIPACRDSQEWLKAGDRVVFLPEHVIDIDEQVSLGERLPDSRGSE